MMSESGKLPAARLRQEGATETNIPTLLWQVRPCSRVYARADNLQRWQRSGMALYTGFYGLFIEVGLVAVEGVVRHRVPKYFPHMSALIWPYIIGTDGIIK